MIRTRLTALAVAAATVATVLASPAYADVDTDFSTQLHTYGIYGPRDYNAWIGKITCKRLDTGVDHDGYQSADFLAKNLPRGTTTEQTWQFLATAINFYCPDLTTVLAQAATPR